MIAQTYNLRDGYYGRTFNGIIVTLEAGNEITGIPIKMDVRDRKTNELVASYSIGNGIEVLSDLSFKFAPKVLGIPAGIYNYDILLSYANHESSYLSGIWKINETVTTK